MNSFAMEQEVSRGAMAIVDETGLIIEGELSKKSAMTWKRRYFELRDGRMAYFAKRGDTKVRGELELTEHAKVVDYDRRAHAFQVRDRMRVRSVFWFRSTSGRSWVAGRESWVVSRGSASPHRSSGSRQRRLVGVLVTDRQ